MASLYGALEVFENVTMEALRTKSLALGALCQRLIDQNKALQDLELASPANPQDRGSQIAYRHPEAYAICQALIERDIVADFRAPDLLRVGFAPLYLKYADVSRLVEALAEIMHSKSYRLERFRKRSRVT
jgi:kynureninase